MFVISINKLEMITEEEEEPRRKKERKLTRAMTYIQSLITLLFKQTKLEKTQKNLKFG